MRQLVPATDSKFSLAFQDCAVWRKYAKRRLNVFQFHCSWIVFSFGKIFNGSQGLRKISQHCRSLIHAQRFPSTGDRQVYVFSLNGRETNSTIETLGEVHLVEEMQKLQQGYTWEIADNTVCLILASKWCTAIRSTITSSHYAIRLLTRRIFPLTTHRPKPRYASHVKMQLHCHPLRVRLPMQFNSDQLTRVQRVRMMRKSLV